MIANYCYVIIPITINIPFRIIIVLVPLAFVLYDVQHRYRPASRDLKRVSSTSLSPIYSHFSETLSGLTTVRAMKSVGRFEQECLDKVEANQKAQFASVAAAQWLELRLQVTS
jgi:ATP-binding cassette subfamily C (CFTR/MRP) protein 10